ASCGLAYIIWNSKREMVNRVEYLLVKSFLRRDIKPDNLLMGLGRRANQELL
ncbi:hypothetical protein MKW98_025357, partial [Papaver atlanticum]